MIPILTRFGTQFLFSFTVVLGVGLVLGFALTVWLADDDQPAWWDGWLALMAAAWLGGRLVFYAVNWDYFQQRPSEMGHIWQLGLVYHGALLGGFLGLWSWCRWGKRPFYLYAGLFAPAFALLMTFGWAACWFDACAYGAETTLGFFAADLPDEYGVFAVRYQTQMLGVVLSVGVFTAVMVLRKRVSPAVLFLLTLCLLSLIQLFLTFFRGDSVSSFAGYRLDTVLNLLLVLISLMLLQYEFKKQKRDLNQNSAKFET